MLEIRKQFYLSSINYFAYVSTNSKYNVMKHNADQHPYNITLSRPMGGCTIKSSPLFYNTHALTFTPTDMQTPPRHQTQTLGDGAKQHIYDTQTRLVAVSLCCKLCS